MGLINDNRHVTQVCRIGQGNACCRYLTVGPDGWDCVKLSTEPTRSLLEVMEGRNDGQTAKQILDERVRKGEMHARGDNCEGR